MELEQLASSQLGNMTSADVVAQVRARLALYQETVPIVQQLAQVRFEK